jgi:hypothetical protein
MLHINIYVQHVNIFPWKFFFFPQFTCVSFVFMNMKTYFLFRLFFFFFLLALFFCCCLVSPTSRAFFLINRSEEEAQHLFSSLWKEMVGKFLWP